MGLRFRKSFKVAPGVRFNVGKKSGSKLYLGVEFRTFLIFDIKIGIGVTLSYN